MLYHITTHVKDFWPSLGYLDSFGVRIFLAGLTGLLLSMLFGRWFIAAFQDFLKSATREWLPERHKQKGIMPTMGGVFVIAAAVVSALLWSDLSKAQVWIFLMSLIGFGAIGFYDDWCKIKYQRGMTASLKIRLQWSMAGLVAFLLIIWQGLAPVITIPFFKSVSLHMGVVLFIVWIMFILVGTSNAVNLTDGLDGLAISSLIPNFFVYALICYCACTGYIPRIDCANVSELAVLGAIMTGACAGFFWYNRYPARIFMGDVGALSLGGSLALLAIMAKQELLLVITGAIFVTEVLSVIAQVLSFKYRGKRIFKMAPIHHHFEMEGWPETTIVRYFSAMSWLLCAAVFMLLRLR